MELILNILLLLIGFVFLIKGADLFVDGSSSVAKILRIPSIIVGVTVVSMGTSLPELAVSIAAAMRGSNEIAISNVVGSNTFNFMVALGLTAVFAKTVVPVQDSLLKVDFPLGLISTVLLLLLSVDLLWKGDLYESGHFFSSKNATIQAGTIGRANGICLLVILILYMIYTVSNALKARKNELALEAATNDASSSDNKSGNNVSDKNIDALKYNETPKIDEAQENKASETSNYQPFNIINSILSRLEKKHPVLLAIIFIIVGAVMIKFGGDFVVQSATYIAGAFGMSQTLIGLTIVACGTSLPELVTSLVAARKGEIDLAVGNVIGSNLFNILFILGVSSTIHPIAILSGSVVDICILILTTLIGTLFCFRGKSVNKVEGVIMFLIYIIYLTYIILR